MIPEKDTHNPIAFFTSVLFLGVCFFLYLYLRPVPPDPKTYVYLANLRALTESGVYFGPQEPLSILLLYFWKSLFNLNYLTTLQSLAAFIFSLSLHLILLLILKRQWKLNHYFLVYFSAFLPLSHEFPIVFFHELLGLLLILLIFHTFRMESILDLILFPVLVTAAFLADLRFFVLGFTVFAVFRSYLAGEKVRMRTTVFYKRKNIPYILLFGYLFCLISVLILFSYLDFFSPSSLKDLFIHWGKICLYLFPAFSTIFLGKVLLDTEKELRSPIFTSILIVITVSVILWNYSKYNPNSNSRLESEKDLLIKSIPMLEGSTHAFIPPETAHFLYFKTKIRMNYLIPEPAPPNSYLRLEEIWQADINEINRLYSSRKGKAKSLVEVIPLGDRTAFLSRETEIKILKDRNAGPLQKKILEAKQKIPKYSPYHNYLEWLLSRIGFSHLQQTKS